MRRISFLMMLTLPLFCLGCATLFKGKTASVDMNSDPVGAQVFVDGFAMGVTPLKLKLDSTKSHTVEFKKEGFESRTYLVNTKIGAGWVILDVIGGLVPVIIDAATGSWHNLDTDHVNASLVQKEKVAA